VHAQKPAGPAQGFGNVVHVLAEEVGTGRTPPDLGVLMERLDSVWDALAFDAPWKSEQEKAAAREALERFLRWHTAARGRTAVAAEHPFAVTVKAGDRTVELHGSMDRVERDAEGRAYVVDFKTGKEKVSGRELADHPQLGVYQLAVREGALEGLPGFAPEDGPPPSGGAELVQLRVPRSSREPDQPTVQAQDPLTADGDGGWVGELVAEAADRILGERFVPTSGDACTHCAFRRSCTAHPEGRQVIE
jgi:RecB family exonuclease